MWNTFAIPDSEGIRLRDRNLRLDRAYLDCDQFGLNFFTIEFLVEPHAAGSLNKLNQLLQSEQKGAVSKPPISYPHPALTGEEKAAILAGDDWTAPRRTCRQTPQPSDGGCRRCRISGCGAALHFRRARRASHRSHTSDSHACPRRRSGALRISFFARKTFL